VASYSVGRINRVIAAIDDDEVLGLARFTLDDAGHEDRGIADDHPPGSQTSACSRDYASTRLTIAA